MAHLELADRMELRKLQKLKDEMDGQLSPQDEKKYRALKARISLSLSLSLFSLFASFLFPPRAQGPCLKTAIFLFKTFI